MLDARKFEKDFVFNIQAHSKSCTSVSMSPGIEGLLVSTSLDGKVKVWDVKD
jgi:WD40 repeat protein